MLKRVSLIIAVWAFTAVSASACYDDTWPPTFPFPHFGNYQVLGSDVGGGSPLRNFNQIESAAKNYITECSRRGNWYKRTVARVLPDLVDSDKYYELDYRIEDCIDTFTEWRDERFGRMCDDIFGR